MESAHTCPVKSISIQLLIATVLGFLAIIDGFYRKKKLEFYNE